MIEPALRFLVDAHPAMLWRGALALTAEPPLIFYHDTPIGLSPAETALMALLVRRGRATHRDIAEALARAGANIASLDVITYRIRRKFAGAGARDPIETHRRWGLALRVGARCPGVDGVVDRSGRAWGVVRFRSLVAGERRPIRIAGRTSILSG